MTRRDFTTHMVATATVGVAGAEAAKVDSKPARKFRAAIIGHTGEGDYGHGLDVIFNDHADIEVAAIADADTAALAKAAERSKARRQYADWREMIAKEKPDLVCLASRWTHERHAMGMAALEAGAHLITEKPFTTTLAEADNLLGTAERAGRKIAVAHQMRLAPSVTHLKKALDEGLIGTLLEMRAWGKQDDRAGGEDMIVLGSHLFDLMRLFGGDASWCTARVLHAGQDITRQHARAVKERIGSVAGDEVFGQFAFDHGVNGTFTSRKSLRQAVGHWGIEFIGSKTSARLLADVYPAVHVLTGGTWSPNGRTDQWQPLDGNPVAGAEDRGFGAANRRVLDDWVKSIENQRDPGCSGYNAMKSIEMIMAIYHAALTGRRSNLPLKDRHHPMATPPA